MVSGQSDRSLTPQVVLRQANTLIEEEKWNDAIRLLEPGVDNGDMGIEGKALLAKCYSHIGDYDGAIKLYRELCQEEPREAKWLYYLGYQYSAKQDYPNAIVAFEKCLEIYPKWILVILNLGKVYELAGLPDKAIQSYREGIKVFKEMPAERQRGLGNIYSKLCTCAAKIMLKRDKIRDSSVTEECERLLKESCKYDPGNADNWYKLGSLLLEIGRLDEAMEHLAKAKSFGPKKAYISHRIAQIYMKKGDVEEALKIYQGIPNFKKIPYIVHASGLCLERKGEKEEAARYLFTATQLEPGKFYHHWDLALILTELGDIDQATKEFEVTNQLFKREYGQDYEKALSKMKEIEDIPTSKHVELGPIFEVPRISTGRIIRYNEERAFGFIRDEGDGESIFFHIKNVKRFIPSEGVRVKFVRDKGEKGLRALKVWMI